MGKRRKHPKGSIVEKNALPAQPKKERLQAFVIPGVDGVVVVLHNKEAFHMCGCAKISILRGTVDISGAMVHAPTQCTVYAPEHDIEETFAAVDEVLSSSSEHLDPALQEIMKEHDGTIVLVRWIELHPAAAWTGWHPKKKNECMAWRDVDPRSQLQTAWSSYGTTLCKVKSSVVVACGARGTGKSSFLARLANMMLGVHKEVLWVDLDPGQGEFQPPGVLSVHKISKPIWGPSYSHPDRMWEHACFVGGTSILEIGVKQFHRCIRMLVDKVDRGNVPVLVNTHGWSTGSGWDSLHFILKSVQPTHVVVMGNDKPLMTAVQQVVPSSTVQGMPGVVSSPKQRWTARHTREAMVLSYFAHTTWQVGEWSTVSVPWKAVTLQGMDSTVHVLPLSIIGLCMDTECVGVGVVRAIDAHRVYLTTPVSWETVQKVTTLVVGKISVPVAWLQPPHPHLTSEVLQGKDGGAGIMRSRTTLE